MCATSLGFSVMVNWLRAMGETFQHKSTESDPKDEQIHELTRTVAIHEEVIRQLLSGQLPTTIGGQ
ncbi:hypothetical protein ACH4VM_39285 [Streptomyces sp. NPDC020792]|uniref:hypothetical protein n=2 Tax=unclassified Streptomyces TaxID=2593676 RepID=UPI0037B7BB1B